MFDVAIRATRKYYSVLGTLLETAALPEVVFSTSFSNRKPHDIPVDYFVGGVTNYHEVKGKAVSQVQLCLNIKQFDWGTYLSTLYVLFHECASHAFHGIFPSSLGRKSPEPYDAFAEGWMDWVAYRIIEEIIDGRGVAAELRNEIYFPDEQLDLARQFHILRLDHEHKCRSTYASQLAIGKSAARKFLHLLERLSKSNADAWQIFLQISLDLNMMLRSADERATFVRTIQRLLPDPGSFDLPQQLETLPNIVHKYLQDLDIQVLVQSVRGLK